MNGEFRVVESTFSNPKEVEADLQRLYDDGWRLIAVTNFMGRNWFYLDREKKTAP